MHVLREDTGEDLTLATPPLARGGEAAVYAVAANPALVAKIYYRPTPEYASKLSAMIAFPPADSGTWTASRYVAWPMCRLLGSGDGRPVIGCLMPHVENARRLVERSNPRARLQTCPLFHYGYLLRSARNLAAAVRGLHERGFVLGDLNESNVLVTPQARVTLVDADSFQVPAPGRVFRCRVGKAEYTPPELQDACLAERDLGPEHDAFALAVLVFQLLMQGLHPFAGVSSGEGNADALPDRIRAGHWPYAWGRSGPVTPAPHAPPWSVLPPAVQELLTCCFEEGHANPGRRPGAAAWQEALEEAEAGMTVCPANTQHHHPRGLDVCPWCEWARQQGRDPFPSPEDLQARRATRLARQTAIGPSSGAALPPRTREALPPCLDPDDPLPPRPTVAVPKPVEPMPAHAAPSSRAVWVAAGAIGAILGIVGVLWSYRPPPAKPRVVLAEPTPPSQPAAPPPVITPTPPAAPRRDAMQEAERALRHAVVDVQEAQSTYQQILRQYEEALREFARNRLPREALTRCLERLLEQARVVRQRQQVLAEKTRLLAEMQPVLLREKP